MDIQTALKIFRISESDTIKELNSSYRRLVLKYHPDRNLHRLEWSHKAMTRLNVAYETAVQHFGFASKKNNESRHDTAHDSIRPDVYTDIRQAFDLVLSGIFEYYQYGLENIHIRTGGSPRFHYVAAIRKTQRGTDRLASILRSNITPSERSNVKPLHDFALAFHSNMKISRTASPNSSAYDAKAYRHYRTASEYLDLTIQSFLFPEISNPKKRHSMPECLSVSNYEFLTVITAFPESSWVTDSVIKSHLLECFVKVTSAPIARM